MTIHQDIDKLFKKGLSDYAENPPGFVWDNIDRKLNSKRLKRKRNIIYSIAASIALLLSFGAGYMFTGIKTTNFVALNVNEVLPTNVSEEEVNNESNQIRKVTNPDTQGKTSESVEGKQIEEPKIVPVDMPEQKIENESENPVAEPSGKVKKVNSAGTLLPPMFGDYNDYNTEETIAYKEVEDSNNSLKTMELKPLDASKMEKSRDLNYDKRQLGVVSEYTLMTIDEKKVSSWSVGVAAAPLLSYRDVAVVSSENLKNADVYSSYEQNYSNEKPLMSYSAGMNVNYKVAKRWRIQSGLYFSEMGQVSENVSIDEQQMNIVSGNNSYSINTSTGNIDVQGSPNELIVKFSRPARVEGDYALNGPSENSNYEKSNTGIETSFVQTYEFYEVPVVANYTIVDRKLSMNVNGGVSANILYANKAYVENDGDRYELDAESEDLKNMNYSGVFGFGIEYPIISKLKLNLNPTFRYALSSINTSGTVYPYSFAIYTGLRYSF